MSKRISHSLLDPYFAPLVPRLYAALSIPRRFPPEAIVGIGHLLAIAGAFGFAYSVASWWGGLLLAAGVVGNHIADMVDGTHARSTGQCRNGGELLDHFTDPLSFSYWMIGWGVAVDSLAMSLIGVIFIYATAVLTSIKAKLLGEFTLARIGPTEMKALLAGYGVVMSALGVAGIATHDVARVGFAAILVSGVLQLVVNLVLAVREVNRRGAEPDTTPWETEG
jgi:archaetidylinositol phosphate synthase